MSGGPIDRITEALEEVHGERRLKGRFLWTHYHDVLNRIWYDRGLRGERLAIERLRDLEFDATFPFGVPEMVTGQDTNTGAPGWSITDTEGGTVAIEPQDLRIVAEDELEVPIVDLIDNVLIHEIVHVHTNQWAFVDLQERFDEDRDWIPADGQLEESPFRLSEEEVVKVTGVILTDRTTDAILDWTEKNIA